MNWKITFLKSFLTIGLLSCLIGTSLAQQLSKIGGYRTGLFDKSAAEIPAFDPETKKLFVVNAGGQVDVFDMTDPSSLSFMTSWDIKATLGGTPNSVAVKNGVVAVAIEREIVIAKVATQGAGLVAFYNTDGVLLKTVEVGMLPDMVTFTPDGNKVITANEGEPSGNYEFDPKGSVSVIDISTGVENAVAKYVGFEAFDAKRDDLVKKGVRLAKEVRKESVVSIKKIGAYRTGIFDESAAEIPAYDVVGKQLFVVKATGGIDVLDMTDPTALTKKSTWDIKGTLGGTPNSVAVYDSLVAVAVERKGNQGDTLAYHMPGYVALYTTAGVFIDTVKVGALPDMVTFTHNGLKILTANEGEPSANYEIDPEGSVSIIDLSKGLQEITVKQVGFTHLNDSVESLRKSGVRITGPNATVAQDLEPEYITIDEQDKVAAVVCQENNALVLIDLETTTVKMVKALGFKDHSQEGNGFDGSNKDDKINIKTWDNLYGTYMPDAIASYSVAGQTFYVTANEGDGREYEYNGKMYHLDEADFADLNLDPTAFPDASVQDKDQLGKLTVIKDLGDTDGDGDYDQVYAYGARSFSIWNAQGDLVYDSGDDFEQIIADSLPKYFNASNSKDDFDDRSDNKGPEPEGVTLGVVNGRTYAFVGLERIGGVMVYDVTDPKKPMFIEYTTTRTFGVTEEEMEKEDKAGDLGPEGLVFIDKADSPNGKPLLVVSNEVSGSTVVFEVVEKETGKSFVPSVSQDVEPEYIAVAPNGKKAMVALQENNAFAVLDLEKDSIVDILPLGFKDHSKEGNGLDASNKDAAINIKTYDKLFGVYEPDAIAAYEVAGKTYYISANEGDGRAYGDYEDETRIAKLTLDSAAFPDAATLQDEANLGRLKILNDLGDHDGDGDYDALYAMGGRSFSIWDASGVQVFDSGDAFAKIQADSIPDFFNATNDENAFDDRSDDKGCEAEGVTIGVLDGKTYAFIGLERAGGIMVYDVTDPTQPNFIQYFNDRLFAASEDDVNEDKGGDLGPEGLVYVAPENSPNGKALLIVSYEVSGSTTVYTFEKEVIHPLSMLDRHERARAKIWSHGNKLYLQSNEQQTEGLAYIWDASGRMVTSFSVAETLKTVNTTGWTSGIYFIRLQTAQQSTTERVFIKRFF